MSLPSLPAETRFLFVTGGVISSLGKGIASASIGRLLKSQGYSVTFLKFDPYLNVDPGTMSPYQHGEVFVTHDGAETDLDVGHYERFTGNAFSALSNVTSGQIYETVIERERQGRIPGSDSPGDSPRDRRDQAPADRGRRRRRRGHRRGRWHRR